MASPAPGQRKIDFPDHANISRNMFANERHDIARMPSTPAECPSGLRSATQEQLTILRLFGSEKPFLHMNVCDHSRVLCTRGFEPHFSQIFFRDLKYSNACYASVRVNGFVLREPRWKYPAKKKNSKQRCYFPGVFTR